MNVLFLSLLDFDSISQENIYTDVLREFVSNGHFVYVISPVEKRNHREIKKVESTGYKIIKPSVGNITDTPVFEKGVSLLRFSSQIISCIEKHINGSPIDLFLVATPPVTNDVIIKYIKKKYRARVYLMLKDIWPGNIFKVPLPGGVITQTGVHLFFRHHEKKLYALSDYIGCMSPANVKYVLENNPGLKPGKVHVNPNSISPVRVNVSDEEKRLLRKKYGIPNDRRCLVYGGTLGPGQDISNVVACLRACKDLDCFFFIAGRGVQEDLIKDYIEKEHPNNVGYSPWIAKEEYKKVVASCDIGLVFLRYNSNTPSFPSRILTYMEQGLPVITCTSAVSDMNETVESGAFGWGAFSNDPNSFYKAVVQCLAANLELYRTNSIKYLDDNYLSKMSYNIIMNKLRR